MEKKQFEQYESPHIEVIEVEVEKGFAISGDGDDTRGNWEFYED